MVARGGKFVYAQVIGDVVGFLGLDEATGPALDPGALAERADHVFATAIRLTRQMPDTALGNILPDRPRSWLVLMHHVFQIPIAFLDCEQSGAAFTYEMLVEPPPAEMRSSAAVAEFERSDAAGHGLAEHGLTEHAEPAAQHPAAQHDVRHDGQHAAKVNADGWR